MSDHPGAVRRSARRERWTTINNRLIEDPRLSFEAVGLLIYLLSKPDDWVIMMADLCRREQSKEYKIRRIMSELKAAGYAGLEYAQADDGTMLGRRWYVSEDSESAPTLEKTRRRGKSDGRSLANVEETLPIVSTETAPSTDVQSLRNGNNPRATSNGDVGAGEADLVPEVAPPTERHAGSSSPWDTLGRTIAFDLTGSEERAYITRGRRAGALQAWIGHIVGDVGRIAKNDPGAALDLWIMFRASVQPDDWERYVSRTTARERFGKWTLNGGAASVAAVLAGRGDTRVTPGDGAA